MRLLPAILLLALAAHAGELPAPPSYPLWNGQETIEEYAKRAGLEPTKTLDLGNGVKLEMVLIPASKFTMGTPEPEPEELPIVGRTILLLGGGLLAALVLILVIRAVRRRRWPQFSLRFLLLLVLAADIALWGGVREWQARVAWQEYARSAERAALGHDIRHYLHSAREDLDETAHEVTLTRPFYLGKFEVTQAQYEQVVGVNPTGNYRNQPRPVVEPGLPVVTPGWYQAQEFCDKATAQLGRRIRLPSEAEWEFACRAGTRTNFYSGDAEADLGRVAWYSGNSFPRPLSRAAIKFPHPGGQKDPNAFGLHDMHGNVSEWCQDLYGKYPSQAVLDPKGAAEGSRHVARGGSCESGPTFSRSARRFVHVGFYYVGHIGFRVAADVPPKAP